MTHSPTPWKLIYMNRFFMVKDANDGHVLLLQDTGIERDFLEPIIKAVNAHDELVAACRTALGNLICGAGLTAQQDKDIDAAISTIKAALNKAGAE